jgi:MATE family multidrug resistance protein
MWRTENWREEFKGLLGLSWPLIVNNLSIAGIHTADAMMSGRLGAESLAAVAVGGSVWFFGFAFVMVSLMAISPIAARHYGAGNPELIGRYTRHGMYLAIIAGLAVIFIGSRLVGPALERIGIDPEFRQLTVDYVHALVLGAPAIFIFLALRFTNEGMGETKPIMYASVFSLVANVFLNYVLMFGHFGAPALGVVGCGYASAITMWLIMIALAIYMMKSRKYRPLKIFTHFGRVRPEVLKEILVLGIPISITITAEAGLFNAVSVLMGTRGAAIAARHDNVHDSAGTEFGYYDSCGSRARRRQFAGGTIQRRLRNPYLRCFHEHLGGGHAVVSRCRCRALYK